MSIERMMSWNGGTKASSRPFLIQYLTLMLIILSFMVGSFASRAIGKAQPVPVKAIVPSPQKMERRPVDTFTIEDFFRVGTNKPGAGKVEALQALFTSHDLSAEISTFPDLSTGRASAISQALGRAFEIKRSLEISGIPETSVQTFATARDNGAKIEIKLFSDRRGVSDE